MNIKTITSTDGVNEVDFGSSASRFYWFQNIGTTTVHVSGNADIVAGADGVAELAAGDSVCIETLGGKVYVLGAGKVQIHNTGDKFCPFKNAPAQSGGEAVDAYSKTESDAKYAQKTDIPSSLPANGGDADTVDGLHAEKFMRYEPDKSIVTSINDMTTVGTYGVYTVTPDFPTGYGDWGLLEVQVYGSICYQIIKFESGIIINRAKTVNQTEWTKWKEISTTPIKSTGQITSPTDEYGTIILPNSDTRRYLSISAVGCYAEMFLFNDKYTVHIANGNYEKVINTPVTYNAFYIE
ncbi:MAG: hypothetical protein PUH30_07000 [Oscillospiraceae bacterium]|nr:hypothetical protein [Oscillospiraceae bacterium]